MSAAAPAAWEAPTAVPVAAAEGCPSWVWQRELDTLCGRLSRGRAEEAEALRRNAEESERNAVRRIEEVERRVFRSQAEEHEALQRFLSGWNAALDARFERLSTHGQAALERYIRDEQSRVTAQVRRCVEEAQQASSEVHKHVQQMASTVQQACFARVDSIADEVRTASQEASRATFRSLQDQIQALEQRLAARAAEAQATAWSAGEEARSAAEALNARLDRMEGSSATFSGEVEAVRARLERLEGGSSGLAEELEALVARQQELAEHQAQAHAEYKEHADKIVLTESKLAGFDADRESATRQRTEDLQRLHEQLQGHVQDSEARLRQLLLGVQTAVARETEERHAELRQVTVEMRDASEIASRAESAAEQYRHAAESAEESRRQLEAEWRSVTSQLRLAAERDSGPSPRDLPAAARSGLLRGRCVVSSSTSSLSASSSSAGTNILERLRNRASAEAHRSAGSGSTSTVSSLRQSLQVGAARQLEEAARIGRDEDVASVAGDAPSVCGSSLAGSPRSSRLRSEALTSWIARGSATPFKDASLFAPVPSGASSTTASTLSAGVDDADGLLRRLPMARQVMPPGAANPV